MGRFILKRMALIVFVLWAVATLVFFLVHVTPGDVAEVILIQTNGPEAVTDEALAAIRQKFDLEQPVVVQYGVWLVHAVQGDFGISYRYNMPVHDMLMARLPNTVLLGGVALLIALAVGIPLGVASALKHNRPLDHVARVLVLALSSFPGFWVAIMLIMVFSIWLGWLPTSGMDSVQSIVLPALTLSIASTASTTRMMRTSMLDVLGQDYMVMARAKGLSRRDVLLRHGLRNAIPPVITLVALQVGHILGGAVVIESIFAWPGLGDLFINAVNSKDTPMIEGCTLLIAFGYAFFNLVADIVYALIDPRVKYADSSAGGGLGGAGRRSLHGLRRVRRQGAAATEPAVYVSGPMSCAEGSAFACSGQEGRAQ